jgi:hypothetical protein
MLSYVGPGHWFFLSTVSSLWRDLYTRIASSRMQVYHYDPAFASLEEVTFIPQMTLYSSVFASPSRVRLVHENGVASAPGIFQYAAGRHATVATLVAAREVGMHLTILVMKGAAECNQLSALQFLHVQRCRWHWSASTAAAKRGDLEMLRWIREHGCNWNEHSILSEAASSGDVELAAWVKQQPGVVCNESAMVAAAAKGHTAMCEYLHAEQCPWNESACEGAAASGYVDTLRWLHEHGCPWNRGRVCASAARGGSIGALEYMLQQQQQGIPFTATLLTHLLNYAGAYNHLAAAQWLRQQGAEWPAKLATSRAWSGEMLAWARAEGCTAPTE